MLRNTMTAVAMAAALGLGAAQAQDVKLPSTLTHDGLRHRLVGIQYRGRGRQGAQGQARSDVRVLPAGNDVARLAPLKGGRAQASAMGIGTYFAQEGVFEFAVKEWGPQPLRLMLSAIDCNAISLGVAKDTGVKEIKDLKGKRIGMVVGSPALNQNAFAVLAFAGLTSKDVKLVEFSSFGAMWKGMINNEVDAAVASTITGQVKELETSPRGIVIRRRRRPTRRAGRGCTRSAPTSIRTRRPAARADSARRNGRAAVLSRIRSSSPMRREARASSTGSTKPMIVDYEDYKDCAPGAAGLAVDRQNFDWVIPTTRDRQGVQGGRRLDGGRRISRSWSNARKRWSSRMGRFPQGQSARRQGRVHQGLDGGAQIGPRKGGAPRYSTDGAQAARRVMPLGSAALDLGRASPILSPIRRCRAIAHGPR